MWAEGLFIWIGFGISLVMRAWRVFHEFANRNVRPKELKPHWRDMDYNYLVALNELNQELPTYTEEEKGLAQYLRFNDREDHERRAEKRESNSVRSGGTVSGSFNTLFSPGLRNAFPGALGGVGGVLGGLGGSALAGLAQAQQESKYLESLAQQQQLSQLGRFQQLAQQRSMMQPFSANNDINPLAHLLAQQPPKDVN